MASNSSSTKRLDFSHSFDQPRDIENGSTMLPIFLNDLRRNQATCGGRDLVEVTLEVGGDNSIVLYSVAPAVAATAASASSSASSSSSPTGGVRDVGENVFLSRTASRVFKRTLSRLRSWGSRASSSSSEAAAAAAVAAVDKRGEMKAKAKLMRTTSSAQRALGG